MSKSFWAIARDARDLPPAEWPRDYDSLDHERDDEWRARSTSRKRLLASCVKLRSCWRRGPRQQRRADGSRSASRQTYYRWRKEYGGLKTDQARRMKDLEKENQRLRRAISDLTLDKLILQEAAKGNF